MASFCALACLTSPSAGDTLAASWERPPQVPERMSVMRDVHILITMDVEPLKLDANWTGPEDAASSERFIQGYWDVAARYGYPVSFFIHPEVAQTHRKALQATGEGGRLPGPAHPRHQIPTSAVGIRVRLLFRRRAEPDAGRRKGAVGHGLGPCARILPARRVQRE